MEQFYFVEDIPLCCGTEKQKYVCFQSNTTIFYYSTYWQQVSVWDKPGTCSTHAEDEGYVKKIRSKAYRDNITCKK